MDRQLAVVVLISGSGTNLQAIIDAIRSRALPAEIVVVVSNRAEQQLVIAECMRGLGWDLPDPAAGGGFGAQIRFIQEAGIDPRDPAFQTDITACQAKSGLELGPPGAGGGAAV